MSFFSGFVCTTDRSIASFQAVLPWFVYIMCYPFFCDLFISVIGFIVVLNLFYPVLLYFLISDG